MCWKESSLIDVKPMRVQILLLWVILFLFMYTYTKSKKKRDRDFLISSYCIENRELNKWQLASICITTALRTEREREQFSCTYTYMYDVLVCLFLTLLLLVFYLKISSLVHVNINTNWSVLYFFLNLYNTCVCAQERIIHWLKQSHDVMLFRIFILF